MIHRGSAARTARCRRPAWAAGWERLLAGVGMAATLALGGAAIAQDGGLAGDPPAAVRSDEARSGLAERQERLRARYARWQGDRVAPERLTELPELPAEIQDLVDASVPAEAEP